MVLCLVNPVRRGHGPLDRQMDNPWNMKITRMALAAFRDKRETLISFMGVPTPKEKIKL